MTTLLFVFLAISGGSGDAQDQAPALDGPKQIFHDELLDKMVGSWNLTGKIMGRTANHSVEAGWFLNRRLAVRYLLAWSRSGQVLALAVDLATMADLDDIYHF